jgi:hypothetical protein
MAPGGSSRRQASFGAHQVAEYALAMALVVVGLHVNGRTELVLVVSGGLLALLSIVSKGSLAAWKIIPKRLHLALDLVLAACFALSPVLYLPSYPVIPIVIGEAVAVVLVRMSLTTEIVPAPRPDRGAARSRAAGPVRRSPSGASSTAAASAGRLFGSAVSRARDSRAPLNAARGLGRATGHARRLGRAAAAAKPAPDAPRSVAVPPAPSEPSS